MHFEILPASGGPSIVQVSGFGGGRVGQVDDGTEADDDDRWVLTVVLAEVEHHLVAGGGVGDEDLPQPRVGVSYLSVVAPVS